MSVPERSAVIISFPSIPRSYILLFIAGSNATNFLKVWIISIKFLAYSRGITPFPGVEDMS
jgi:hypothetical protein